MGKIFRKTRQHFLSEGKTIKYLKYAVGEIALVVIGILIAVGLNNRNQNIKNEEKIISIFKDIQSDLLLDLEASNAIFSDYIDKDSISKKILNNTYTYREIIKNNFKPIGFRYLDFKTTSNGFDNLTVNLDKVPEKYKYLLPEIKNLYVNLNTTIDVANKNIRSLVYQNVDDLTDFNWYLDFLKRKPNNEMDDYFLNDVKYKRLVAKYMEYSNPVFKISIDYRIKAIDLYLKINEAINSTVKVPEIVNYKNRSSNDYTGVYTLKETVNRGWLWQPKINIIEKDDQLVVIYPDLVDYQFEIQSYNMNSFFFMDVEQEIGGILIFDKPKKGQLYFSGGTNTFAIYEKVESN